MAVNGRPLTGGIPPMAKPPGVILRWKTILPWFSYRLPD